MGSYYVNVVEVSLKYTKVEERFTFTEVETLYKKNMARGITF